MHRHHLYTQVKMMSDVSVQFHPEGLRSSGRAKLMKYCIN